MKRSGQGISSRSERFLFFREGSSRSGRSSGGSVTESVIGPRSTDGGALSSSVGGASRSSSDVVGSGPSTPCPQARSMRPAKQDRASRSSSDIRTLGRILKWYPDCNLMGTGGIRPMSDHPHADHPHGPENAEHELKKAYNCVI